MGHWHSALTRVGGAVPGPHGWCHLLDMSPMAVWMDSPPPAPTLEAAPSPPAPTMEGCPLQLALAPPCSLVPPRVPHSAPYLLRA